MSEQVWTDYTEQDLSRTHEEIEVMSEQQSDNFCPECGQHYFVHNNDGSCVLDKPDYTELVTVHNARSILEMLVGTMVGIRGGDSTCWGVLATNKNGMFYVWSDPVDWDLWEIKLGREVEPPIWKVEPHELMGITLTYRGNMQVIVLEQREVTGEHQVDTHYTTNKLFGEWVKEIARDCVRADADDYVRAVRADADDYVRAEREANKLPSEAEQFIQQIAGNIGELLALDKDTVASDHEIVLRLWGEDDIINEYLMSHNLWPMPKEYVQDNWLLNGVNPTCRCKMDSCYVCSGEFEKWVASRKIRAGHKIRLRNQPHPEATPEWIVILTRVEPNGRREWLASRAEPTPSALLNVCIIHEEAWSLYEIVPEENV